MKKLILLALGLVLALPSMAQSQWGPEWGDTPEERSANVRMMNNYQGYIVREDWGAAAVALQDLIAKVPTAHPQIYTLAFPMYLKRADQATDPAEKVMLGDSLILMHDKFLEYFADKYPNTAPGVWNNRAIYIQRYHGDDKARVLEAFREAVEHAGTARPGVVVSYFAELTAAYAREEVSAEDYMSEYDRLGTLLAGVPDSDQQVAQLEKLFVESGMANCENIEKIQSAKIAENPDDAELLDRTIALLNRAKCTGDFYMSVAEKLYKVRPTAMNARIIAMSYRTKGDNATAARYLQEAISLAETPKEKVDLLLGIAADDLINNNFHGAYTNAHQAAQIDPGNATASYLAAMATAGGANSCSDALAKRAVYWLAYDRMLEARRLAGSDSSIGPDMMRNIESSIARFASAFPTAEDLFLQGISEGSGYTVNCGWVSGRTTVRRRP